MALDPKDLQVTGEEDRPLSGMWHCGPNPCWITVTHTPTMASVRAYSGQRKRQHHTREIALAALELIVSEINGDECKFPERLAATKGDA
jgi:hypothetical protein